MVISQYIPTCHITGILKKVEFERQKTISTFEDNEPFLPGRKAWVDIPAQFRLTVQIQEVTYVNGNKNGESCKEGYKIGEDYILFIFQSNVNNEDEFQVGQIITGEVRNGYFNPYSLSPP
jgi:hypothetical protein